uniref:Homeobox domain-containing protein n=1 Tax=Romanomermis culicivorax TaxID=13658 RepID=A0A915KBN1_ROMCU
MIFPKALDLDRPKRPRTTFSDQQLEKLECEYKKNPYLIGKDRCRLAKDLFQNRRTKTKKLKTSPPPPPLDDEKLSSKTPATFSIEYLTSSDFLRPAAAANSRFLADFSGVVQHHHNQQNSLFFPSATAFNFF